MSRPKPDVLLEKIDKNYEKYEIVEIKEIFVIYYDGKIIDLRTNNLASHNSSLKYKKTIFTDLKKANKMKDMLNEIFSTDKFTIEKLNG